MKDTVRRTNPTTMNGAATNPDCPGNVLDYLEQLIQAHGVAGEVKVAIPHSPGRREIRIFGLRPPKGEARHPVLDAFTEIDAVDRVSVGREGSGGIRLATDYVEELGRRLEAMDPGPLRTSDLEASRQVVVDFCDPNACKALHVGHLRSLALGNSVAAIFRTAGAETLTQNQPGDAGRSVGEAMAGYREFGKNGSFYRPGEKADHFIGRCYSQYVVSNPGEVPEGSDEGLDPVLAREASETTDPATVQIDRWKQGDPEAVALWETVRNSALSGHEESLKRLGVAFDRVLPESDYLLEVDAIAQWLLDRTIAVEENGTLIFHTEDSSYPVLVLRRSDGQSTQHLRHVAQWHATRDLLESSESIQIFGDEWMPLRKYGEKLLCYLIPETPLHPTRYVLHGMVTVGRDVMKSSSAAPWLIDDLLEELSQRPEIVRICDGDTDRAWQLAAVVALGPFLASPPSRPMTVSKDVFFDVTLNPGWALACAAAVAWGPENDGSPDPSAQDPVYRFVVLQSQVHRQFLRRACAELDPSYVARYVGHLSRWFLRSRSTPRAARAMRSILQAGMVTLGLGGQARWQDENLGRSLFRA